MNDIEMVQGIFPIIAQRLPKNWQRMVFRASYGEDAYSMEYYVRKSNGVFIQCFEMPGVKEDNLLSDFVTMDKMIEGYRRSLDKKDLWWRMTLAVNADGTFKVDYDYDQIEEADDTWDARYLK